MSSVSSVTVRRATPDDLASILEHTEAFAREAGVGWFNRATARKGIRRALKNPRRFGQIYVVVADDGSVIAQFMLTPKFNEWRNGWTLEISSVFVSDKHRGKGICGLMLREIDSLARQAGDVVELQLYVRSDNLPAVRAYLRDGYQQTTCVVMEKVLE